MMINRTNVVSHAIGESNNIDDAFSILYSILHDAIKKFVPKKNIQNSADPPWYNKQLKHLRNIRNKEYKKCKSSGNFDSYNDAIRINSCNCKVNCLLRTSPECKMNYDLIQNIPGNLLTIEENEILFHRWLGE